MLNVFVAEDDLMIADMVEETLIKVGYEVRGIARTLPEAVRFDQLHRPNLAIIDLKLIADGGRVTDGPRIGVLYVSGNTSLIGDDADGDAYIAKPYHKADLIQALKLIEQIVSDRFVTPPFPRGFHFFR